MIADTGDPGVSFSYNAQDPLVQPAGVTTVRGLRATDDGRPAVEKVVLAQPLVPTSEGYVYPEGDERAIAANAFATVARTVETFEEALGRPIRWAFDGPVRVDSLQGTELNAFYNRDQHLISFSRGWDPKRKTWVHAAASGEVCAHETGHAILDGLRPRYFGSFAPEVNAFHEAFGDMMGMVMGLSDARTLDLVTRQTDGDLSRPNALSDMGEEMGIASNHFAGVSVTGGDYQRTARNRYQWAEPSSLKWMGTPDELGREPHSFGQVWTGAFYDLVKTMYAQIRGEGKEPREALRETGQEALGLLARGVDHGPHGDFTLADMAAAWVRAERAEHGGRWEGAIRAAMEARGILQKDVVIVDRPSIPSLEPPLQTLDVVLRGPEFGQYEGAIVRTTVDASSTPAAHEPLADTIRAFVAGLIAAGQVKYHDPTHVPVPGDASGFTAVVRWEDGRMVLEKVPLT